MKYLSLILSMLISLCGLAHGQSIKTLSLVNADTGKDVIGFTSIAGETNTVDLANGRRLSVVATIDNKTRSVRFESPLGVQVENITPFAIKGDDNGKLTAWTPERGVYPITVTPYAQTDAKGKAGKSVKTVLIVTDTDAPPAPLPVESEPATQPTTAPSGPKLRIIPGQPLPKPKDGWTFILAKGEYPVDSAYWIDVKGFTLRGEPGAVLLTAKRTLQGNGQYECPDTIFVTDKARDVTIDGLTFDSKFKADLSRGGAARTAVKVDPATNVTIQNCTVIAAADFVNSNRGVSGLTVKGNKVIGVTAERGYFVWGAGTNLKIQDNVCPNSVWEHIVRLDTTDGFEVSGNDFSNVDAGVSKVPGDIAKSSLWVMQGVNGTIKGNTFRNSGIGLNPLGGPDGLKANPPQVDVHDITVEDNTFIVGDQAGIQVGPGAFDITLNRNNTPVNVRTSDPLFPNRGVKGLVIDGKPWKWN